MTTDPELTLFCLAHAGGSAHPYLRLGAGLPGRVTVVPLELPGHGTRVREPLLHGMAALTEEAVRLIGERRHQPYAIFGHSFGSLLGYEAARVLTAQGTPPKLLLVSGRNGPTEPLSHRPFAHLPDDGFVRGLQRIGGLPEALLAEPELLKFYLPAIRADLRVVETYTHTPGPRLTVPVAAFAGSKDVLTDAASMAAWSRITTGVFDLTLVSGGHFFLQEPEFRAALGARLTRYAATASRDDAVRGPVARAVAE
ncbi:oleoyl-ACP hydrolase [Streptomyces sp. NBRC 14336]|uniref:thioesterase II family protein n=1 Tax=Streptomyces sp. NBRC 14336 TaxID=3030992 RepID=UPI0024A13419|nr:alpha/beta fold hydrolase [Streptomyces sp. NBRC 14336]WBO80939.1 alpha/beta fold hydrolase [Streptomyces sp. SBE_14.2]GLW48200.1 oleoyl-ACP hydrolase [Streptomyces sp. NBRC 14336]